MEQLSMPGRGSNGQANKAFQRRVWRWQALQGPTQQALGIWQPIHLAQ